MEEGINYEVENDNRLNLIEENREMVSHEDEDSTEVGGKEENVTIDSERNIFSKNDDNLNEICEGKEIIDESCVKDGDSVE